MNSGICSQISSSCNCPIIRQYFVFKTVLVCFWINCVVAYREIILYDSYSRRTSFVENKDVKVSAINMQSFFPLTCDQVFFFRRKLKSRRTGKEDKKNAPFSIRLPDKREGGPPDSRLCFLSKTVCLPCLVRREWAFITRRSYGTKRTKIYIPCWMANDPVGPWKKKDRFLNDVISVFLLPLGVVCPTARCVLYHATVSCKGSILYQPLPIHPMRNLVDIK